MIFPTNVVSKRMVDYLPVIEGITYNFCLLFYRAVNANIYLHIHRANKLLNCLVRVARNSLKLRRK